MLKLAEAFKKDSQAEPEIKFSETTQDFISAIHQHEGNFALLNSPGQTTTEPGPLPCIQLGDIIGAHDTYKYIYLQNYDGLIIGVRQMMQSPNDDKNLWFTAVAVHEDYRDRGYSSALIYQAMEYAQNLNATVTIGSFLPDGEAYLKNRYPKWHCQNFPDLKISYGGWKAIDGHRPYMLGKNGSQIIYQDEEILPASQIS